MGTPYISNGGKAQLIKPGAALMGANLNDLNGRTQTANLGVRDSNPFGYAIYFNHLAGCCASRYRDVTGFVTERDLYEWRLTAPARAIACLERFRPVSYATWFDVLPDIRARFWNAGHK